MRRSVLLLLVALTLFFATTVFADVILYMQPPTFDGTFYASQNDSGGYGNFAQMYDNFKIYSHTDTYRLDDVEWFGGYWNGAGNSITGWTISIYADAANTPGSALWSRYFPVSYPNYMESCFYPNSTCAYDVDLIAHGPYLHPNTQYWLSVLPDLAFPPQWGSGTGMMGDSLSYQYFFGSMSPVHADMALNIQGVPSPEPTTLLLVGGGVLGMAARLRRKMS